MRRLLLAALLLAPVPAAAQSLVQQLGQQFDVSTAAVHSHTASATLTIVVPGSQYAYITGMDISVCATGTAVTAAAPTYITTTGLSGSPQYQLGSSAAAGLCTYSFGSGLTGWSTPLKSQTPGTNVTFVLPAFATNQVASVNVYYYIAY